MGFSYQDQQNMTNKLQQQLLLYYKEYNEYKYEQDKKSLTKNGRT